VGHRGALDNPPPGLWTDDKHLTGGSSDAKATRNPAALSAAAPASALPRCPRFDLGHTLVSMTGSEWWDAPHPAPVRRQRIGGRMARGIIGGFIGVALAVTVSALRPTSISWGSLPQFTCI
jgi:hypothetical protein